MSYESESIEALKIDVLALKRFTAELSQRLNKKMDGIVISHISENSKYKLVIERAASAKGVIGVKVEANGDSISGVLKDAGTLFSEAVAFTCPVLLPNDCAKDLTSPTISGNVTKEAV